MSFAPVVTIESTDFEGHGVARLAEGESAGKTVFVDGALPGETVAISVYRKKPSFEKAKITDILKPSSQRVEPACEHFGVCGGCTGQHHDYRAQVAVKQRVLEDCLSRIGNVTPERLLPALYGEPWEYRHRARLSVRHVEKKGGVLVGFHERGSSFVADMRSCKTLPRKISDLLLPLRALVTSLSCKDRMPQIEVAVGDNTTALVFRIMQALTPKDEQLFKDFADTHQIQIYFQTKGPETAEPFYPKEWTLSYHLPEFGLKFRYKPTEFTQVNPNINQMLVRMAMAHLQPQAGERVADLFCGLGNFSLPIARLGAEVIGVEGAEGLVERARTAALENHISNAKFLVSNLFEATGDSLAALGHIDRMLIDPPRDGAVAVCLALPPRESAEGLKKIVYVSCNPATLARDAEILVNVKGYRLRAAGVANMFPHTAHVESIAVFD